MAGRWIDEWRAEGSRSGPDRARERESEDRSFDRPVFGERDSGMGYNRPAREMRPDYSSDYRGHDDDRPAWQDRDYEGVSPGFRQHERDYESGYRANPRFPRQDHNSGGGFPRDREDYGNGARGYERGAGQSDFEDRARDAGDYLRRQGRKVANWFGDVAGEGSETGRYEARGARGLGPKGYKRSDERITEDVHQHLTEDLWLDASDVDVAVANGEVTLSGTVENRSAKHHAEHLVEDLPGVTHVQNNLRARAGKPASSAGSYGDASMETSANTTHTTTRK